MYGTLRSMQTMQILRILSTNLAFRLHRTLTHHLHNAHTTFAQNSLITHTTLTQHSQNPPTTHNNTNTTLSKHAHNTQQN